MEGNQAEKRGSLLYFSFFDGYFNTALKIEDKGQRLQFLENIFYFMFQDREPQGDSMQIALFEACRATLQKSKDRVESGRKGGKANKPKQPEANQSKPEANRSKPEANQSKPEANRSIADKKKNKEEGIKKKEEGIKNKEEDIKTIEKDGESGENPAPPSHSKKRIPPPPTLEEVKAYIAERGSPIDPVHFFNYYAAAEWKDKDGKPVLSWKQRLISWEGRSKKKEEPPKAKTFMDLLKEGEA